MEHFTVSTPTTKESKSAHLYEIHDNRNCTVFWDVTPCIVV